MSGGWCERACARAGERRGGALTQSLSLRVRLARARRARRAAGGGPGRGGPAGGGGGDAPRRAEPFPPREVSGGRSAGRSHGHPGQSERGSAVSRGPGPREHVSFPWASALRGLLPETLGSGGGAGCDTDATSCAKLSVPRAGGCRPGSPLQSGETCARDRRARSAQRAAPGKRRELGYAGGGQTSPSETPSCADPHPPTPPPGPSAPRTWDSHSRTFRGTRTC